MRQRVVHQRGPGKDEYHGRKNATSLGGSTENNGGNQTGEHHFVGGENDFGKLVVCFGNGSAENAHEAEVFEVAPEGSASFGEDERVAPGKRNRSEWGAAG